MQPMVAAWSSTSSGPKQADALMLHLTPRTLREFLCTVHHAPCTVHRAPYIAHCAPRTFQADALLLTDQLVLQHAPLLSPVLPEPIRDNQWTMQLSGEARKEATIHVMAHVLEKKLGGAHSTLMFDDTHWMDSSSWALLNAVT